MKKADRAPKVEVVSEGPPVRSLAEILRNPPTLELVGILRTDVRSSGNEAATESLVLPRRGVPLRQVEWERNWGWLVDPAGGDEHEREALERGT